MSATNLFAQQRHNRRWSALLVALFVLFFAWIGFGADLILHLQTAPGQPRAYVHRIPFVGILMSLLALGMAWVSWKRGPKQVLWATGAWELVNPRSPKEKQFVNVVEEMAIASGLPKPKIWIMSDPDPNAFSTGTDERNAHVAVTEGLPRRARPGSAPGRRRARNGAHQELRRATHDLVGRTGALALISEGMWRFLGYGGRVSASGARSRGRSKKGGGLVLLLIVVWLISVLLAPLVSRLLALAVSRKREYLADATAAQFTRNPGALATALETIGHAAAPTKSIKRGSAHLCIADPLGRRVSSKQGLLADVLATHPPMAVRVARLRRMAYQYEKTGVLPETV